MPKKSQSSPIIRESKNDYRSFLQDNLLNNVYTSWLINKEDQLFTEFDNKIYWCKVDNHKINKDLSKVEAPRVDNTGFNLDLFMIFCRNCKVTEIGNFTIQFLYFQRDSITQESFYFTSIKNKNNKIKLPISPKSLASSTEFKATIMGSLPGAIFLGNTNQLNQIFKDKAHDLKNIETIPYVGYCKENKAYIFEKYAVKLGQIYPIHDEGYFQLPNNLNIKSTLALNFTHHIEYKNEWLQDFIITFGHKGIIALAFWVGTLFVQQIREREHPWPFLTITGQAGAGKSFLIEFLWKLFGRNQYEGENPSSGSHSARSRYLMQVSNLPIVFIEGDIDDPYSNQTLKGFNVEVLKALFDGNSPRITAKKTTDNTINSQPFRGGLVISQNRRVEGSEAIESRLIDLHFDRSHHTQDSYLSANKLSRLTVQELSGFLFYVLKNEELALQIIDKDFSFYRDSLKQTLQNNSYNRIEVTHALILCCLKFLGKILPLESAYLSFTEAFIHKIALHKTKEIIREPMHITQFWDVYEYLSNNASMSFNHAKDPNQIAINMNEFYRLASQFSQSLEDIKFIQKSLNQSIKHKFIEAKTIRSAITNKTLRCYIFEKGTERL